MTLIIFLGKNLVLKFWGQKGPVVDLKWCFSSATNEKAVYGTFLIFCSKLQRRKNLKLTEMIFLGKVFYWGFEEKSGREFFLGRKGGRSKPWTEIMFFFCFKFLELFIRIIPSIKKWLWNKVFYKGFRCTITSLL